MPTRARIASMFAERSVTSVTPSRTRPDVGSSRRLVQRSSVDLPEPDGPTTQVVRPPGTSRQMSCRTGGRPKVLLTWADGTEGPVTVGVWGVGGAVVR